MEGAGRDPNVSGRKLKRLRTDNRESTPRRNLKPISGPVGYSMKEDNSEDTRAEW
jgi:hypothetical protein